MHRCYASGAKLQQILRQGQCSGNKDVAAVTARLLTLAWHHSFMPSSTAGRGQAA